MPRPQNELCLSVEGIRNSLMNVQSLNNNYVKKACISLKPGEFFESQVFVLLPYSQENKPFKEKYFDINFVVSDGNKFHYTAESIFYVSK